MKKISSFHTFAFSGYGSVEGQDEEFDVGQTVDAGEHGFGFGGDGLDIELPGEGVARVGRDDGFGGEGGVVGYYLEGTVGGAGSGDAGFAGGAGKRPF